MPPSEADIAWASGLFEGEGCISRTARVLHGSPRWTLSVGMTDEDVVRRFHAVVRVGVVNIKAVPNAKPHWKKAWTWSCATRAEVEAILQYLAPRFGSRRAARANEALAEIAELGPTYRGSKRAA